LSQEELAEASGVSAATIVQVELGHRRPQGRTLRKLAAALGVEVADLLEEEETSPKGSRRSSPEPSFADVLDNERRAAWEAAVVEGRRLRETGRGRMWKALSEWSASKRREEPDAARRKYLDEMGDLLQEVYDAGGALGWAYVQAALTEGGSDASVPSYLCKESRAMDHFYGKLFELVESRGLRIRTDTDAAAAERDAKAQPEVSPHAVEDPDAA
jgi:transcriptional regulator with XRE-family HTH domain